MQISNHQIQSIMKTYQKQGVDKIKEVNKAGKVGRLEKPDEAKVSSEAMALNLAKEVASKAPDIREAKVAELQKAIRTGTYSVSNEEIAEKIIARALVDELI